MIFSFVKLNATEQTGSDVLYGDDINMSAARAKKRQLAGGILLWENSNKTQALPLIILLPVTLPPTVLPFISQSVTARQDDDAYFS